jgi:hypothetical protein
LIYYRRGLHGEIDSIVPKVAVLLIGTNDIGWPHRTAADTVVDIDAVVAELHLRLAATTDLMVGLLPSDRGTWVPAGHRRDQYHPKGSLR